MFPFQVAQVPNAEPPPGSVEGWVVVLLMALATAAPTILKEVVKILGSFADWIRSRTDSQIKSTDAFKFLMDEVNYLRKERDQQELEIAEAKASAEEANRMLKEVQKKADESDRMLMQVKVQVEVLQNQLGKASDENRAIRNENYELKAENNFLKEENQKLKRENIDLKNQLGITGG